MPCYKNVGICCDDPQSGISRKTKRKKKLKCLAISLGSPKQNFNALSSHMSGGKCSKIDFTL